MKLLTLNTHSLIEENYPEKLKYFAAAIEKERPDIIALQEVNQSISAKVVAPENLMNFIPCGAIAVKEDNHLYNAVKKLSEKGIVYYWTWLGIKCGYGKYDEGIGILSRSPVIETDMAAVSSVDDYSNWRTRKIIGICTKKDPGVWFYSVHLGWWNDEKEPFSHQFRRLCSHINGKKDVWLMGDFNSPAAIRNQGYDTVSAEGFYDCFLLAETKDTGITVTAAIDGWQTNKNNAEGMRIDQIWCNKIKDVISSSVIFNGKYYPVVSDHYGVITEIKD